MFTLKRVSRKSCSLDCLKKEEYKTNWVDLLAASFTQVFSRENRRIALDSYCDIEDISSARNDHREISFHANSYARKRTVHYLQMQYSFTDYLMAQFDFDLLSLYLSNQSKKSYSLPSCINCEQNGFDTYQFISFFKPNNGYM